MDSAIVSADDEDRKSDIETSTTYLESFYTSGSQYDSTIGQYPSVDPANPLTDDDTTTNTNEINLLRNVDPASLIAPGSNSTTKSSLIKATNSRQNTEEVLPQPTVTQYVYQQINDDGFLCDDITTDTCRKFNLYYRTEADDTVRMVTSRHQ